jgi:hypothetical protein
MGKLGARCSRCSGRTLYKTFGIHSCYILCISIFLCIGSISRGPDLLCIYVTYTLSIIEDLFSTSPPFFESDPIGPLLLLPLLLEPFCYSARSNMWL